MHIIFTRGLQGSGKTTWAKDFVKKNQNYKRVSRDDVRHMISSYTFDDKNEALVTVLEDDIIEELLAYKYNLVIDEMNLNVKRLNDRIDWIKKIDPEAAFETKDFPILLDEAIDRDKKRSFVIGEDVIRQTWKKYEDILLSMLETNKYEKLKYNSNLPNCIIVDVDGTLAIRGNRNPYDYSKVSIDKVNESVKLLINSILNGRKVRNDDISIIVISGREHLCYESTRKWLMDNDIDFSNLLMRKTGDHRKDSIIKKEIYEEYILGKYNVLWAVDDRRQVVDMWRELGITVLDVAGNNF